MNDRVTEPQGPEGPPGFPGMPGDPGVKGEKVAPSHHPDLIHSVVMIQMILKGSCVFREKWETVSRAPEDHQDHQDLQDQALDL